MRTLKIRNFGPIGDVDVKFGDLTFLVGPQASGKSLFLELLKYIIDKEFVLSTLRKYNYIIDKKNPQKVLDTFFGDGMNKIFKPDTEIAYNGRNVSLDSLLKRNVPKKESMFYIPAQRILSIADGRPKNFMEFDMATPYVLKSFSETLRIYIQGGMGDPETLFPVSNRLKSALKQSFDENIFHGGKIVMEENSGQKKMKMKIDDMSIPFMTWSAGQKEFMPLLIAFYCLSGPASQVFKKDNYKYVVIEEPEMGLHPQAVPDPCHDGGRDFGTDSRWIPGRVPLCMVGTRAGIAQCARLAGTRHHRRFRLPLWSHHHGSLCQHLSEQVPEDEGGRPV